MRKYRTGRRRLVRENARIKRGVSHASRPESAGHVNERGIRVSLRGGENINSAYNFYAKQALRRRRRRRRRRRSLLVNT